ncbi:putative motility protein [Niallia endozanthoxylica]|uniref:Putative motility protein n=2 Tax=Niallia endozanthoxylica TaxID=2036016 RepID=A0A5J5HNU1_9BACI|nr:putative motility protein [Niallia endozanthoxylica]
MDIALMSMAGSVAASMSVMKKARDQVEGNTYFINKMTGVSDIQALQHAAQPHLRGNVDIKV